MPKDILNPLPTHRIDPAVNMRKNVFMKIKYMKEFKKICLFLYVK
jgi:hypothetical protein